MSDLKISTEAFLQRRLRFAEQMPDNSIAIIFAANEVTRSNDTEYLFCQDKSFWYLTGFNEPDAVLAIEKVENKVVSTLFCLPKDPLAEVWQGRRIGAGNAVSAYGFDQAHDIERLDDEMSSLIRNKSVLLFRQGNNAVHDEQVFTWHAGVKDQARQGVIAPETIVDCQRIIDELRLIKHVDEIAIMRRVNQISGNAHKRAMKHSADGIYEYQLEAEILHEFAYHGARYAAYNCIVAGGDNANILHYTANGDRLNTDTLCLIDAGGELEGYAADITRTFPVNGKFTPEQKVIYQLVLDAQNACIEAVKPGATLAQLNEICNQIFVEGLLSLDILTGDKKQLLEEGASKKYFIHGIGHWLGLDVHDVGDYQIRDRKQHRAFEPGMVMTIEPGLYFPADAIDIDEKWRGIGVRIEDNVLVTDQGHENLTKNVPKSVSDIEALMAANN